MNILTTLFKKKDKMSLVDQFFERSCPTRAHLVKDMSKEEAQKLFSLICEFESQGNIPTTRQNRLNICYTAGLVDKKGSAISLSN